MPRVHLQEMVDDIRFDSLPVNWNAFDIGAFSRRKSLWDYQRKAVEKSINALWKYYEDFGDYQANENVETNRERKHKLFKWYQENGLDEAHKGDREESKRQHIYSILSRNGFLFNFSATFTDARDLATTVCPDQDRRYFGLAERQAGRIRDCRGL